MMEVNYLKDLLYDYYKNNNRIPSKTDITTESFGVSLYTYFKQFQTNSWGEILIKCGLKNKIRKNVIYTKEILLNNLREYYKSLGRIPTIHDFKKFKFKPGMDVYIKNFGSFDNACYFAGLINQYIDKNIKLEQTIKEIKELSHKLNRIPTVEEYENYKTYGYCHTKFNSKFGKSFVNLCKEILPEYSISKRITLNEIEILVREYYEKNNRTPYLKNLGISSNVFKYRNFTINYSEFLRELNLPLPSDYSNDELLNMFHEVYTRIKRIPTANEITIDSELPHWSTYQIRFGSIKSICDLLNIEYSGFYGIGNICVDKNNNVCKSTSEAIISNYFIDNNIKFEKEVSYSEIIKNDKRKFDWKITINNQVYYVEYFGLYLPFKQGRIIKYYIKKTKKKIKDLYKHCGCDNCIFVFPNHLNNLDNVFKKY